MIKHIHINECDSTQDVIKEQLIDTVEKKPILVSCENQTAGRGRGLKSWETMPGTISFSLTIDPFSETSFTALEISLLIALFFESKGQNLKLKWPNDLLNQDLKKCAGVLVQSIHDQMFVGIGINLFSNQDDLGGIYSSDFQIDKKKWVLEISEYILIHRIFVKQILIDGWNNRCCHMNSLVTIREGSENLQGEFCGLGFYGEALLKNEKGIQRIFNGTLRKI